jgi:hypothetical protein
MGDSMQLDITRLDEGRGLASMPWADVITHTLDPRATQDEVQVAVRSGLTRCTSLDARPYADFISYGLRGRMMSLPPLTFWTRQPPVFAGDGPGAEVGTEHPFVPLDGETQLAALHEIWYHPAKYGRLPKMFKNRLGVVLHWDLSVEQARRLYIDLHSFDAHSSRFRETASK